MIKAGLGFGEERLDALDIHHWIGLSKVCYDRLCDLGKRKGYLNLLIRGYINRLCTGMLLLLQSIVSPCHVLCWQHYSRGFT